MPNAIIQINYEQLSKVGGNFTEQAQEVKRQIGTLSADADGLRRGGWRGQSADDFYCSLDQEVFPALLRLYSALESAAVVIQTVERLFRTGEDEAGGMLRSAENNGLVALKGSGSIISPETGKTINDVWNFLTGSVSLFALNKDGLTNLLNVAKSMGMDLKISGESFGMGLTVVGGLIKGTTDWLSGKESFGNAYGSGLQGAGLDIGADLATGGGYSIVVAAGDVTSLGGQMAVGLERSLHQYQDLDPRLQAELTADLNHSDRVFKGIRVSDTLTYVKDLIWDVTGRPIVNTMQASFSHLSKGLQTGSWNEMGQAVGDFGKGLVMTTIPGLGGMAAAGDPSIQQNVMQHFQNLLSHGSELAISLPQLPDQSIHFMSRGAVSIFDNAVNQMPIDPGLRQTLNDASVQFLQTADKMPIGSLLTGGPLMAFNSWSASQVAPLAPTSQ